MGTLNNFLIAVGALIPSLGVGLIFYFVMRSVIRADRNERKELAELDRLADLQEPGATPDSIVNPNV